MKELSGLVRWSCGSGHGLLESSTKSPLRVVEGSAKYCHPVDRLGIIPNEGVINELAGGTTVASSTLRICRIDSSCCYQNYRNHRCPEFPRRPMTSGELGTLTQYLGDRIKPAIHSVSIISVS